MTETSSCDTWSSAMSLNRHKHDAGSAANALLNAGFAHEVPACVRALWPSQLDDAALSSFKAGIILPLGGAPARVYLSDQGEADAWEQRVCSQLGDVRAFLNEGPAGCRRMIDLGEGFAELFLDDLQQHGSAEMSRVLEAATGRRASIRLVERPSADLAPLLAPLPAGAGGKLAERRGDGPPHLLWISEARWRGLARESVGWIEQGWGLPPGWTRIQRALPHCELYVDAIDLCLDGRADVTMGVMP